MVTTVLAVVALLPLIIKGDGSAEGYVLIALRYTLTTVTFLLAVATLWAACSTSAAEIEGKQIHLVVSKPIRHTHILIGKWLGLVTINACLLAISGITVCLLLRIALSRPGIDAADRQSIEQELLVARQAFSPEPEDIEQRARELLTTMHEKGEVTPDIPDEAALAMIADRLIVESNTVRPGSEKRWTIQIGELPRGQSMFVRFSFSSPRQLDIKPTAIVWKAGPPDDPGRFVRSESVFSDSPVSFTVPASAVAPDGSITVDFVNVQLDPPVSIVFDKSNGVTVLARAGSFEGNLARALIIILCKLSILAALGVVAGSLTSMPVATFVSFAAIVVFLFSGFIQNVAYGRGMYTEFPFRSAPIINSLLRSEFKALSMMLEPVTRFNPLSQLPRGELISWRTVSHAVLLLGIAYSGILGALGSFFFSRRELGMPRD
jgi:hypothetical protein